MLDTGKSVKESGTLHPTVGAAEFTNVRNLYGSIFQWGRLLDPTLRARIES